jgi:peptide/nickel transport system ATP-binding protein
VLLSIEGVNLTIGDRAILSDVSLQVEAGRTLGLVGESGSGKSLTALAVMRLLPHGSAASGVIRFRGADLLALDERSLCAIRGRDIGMVFQEPMTALNPLMTISAQVAEGIALHTRCGPLQAQEQARRLLARVGLTPERVAPERFPHELSGGQRQRVVIAMAVALGPKLIIADEPTSALDVTTQAQILGLLKDLVAESGSGLLLISHDLAVVAAHADAIAVMREGRVIDQGETGRFLAQLKTPYARALFTASTHVPSRAPHRTSGGTVLQVEDLVRTYPGRRRSLFRRGAPVRALDGVSLSVRAGESVGIVGESGAGKSTLARAVLGLERPQSGLVRVEGVDLARLSRAAMRSVRQRVQAVFQDPYGSFDPRQRADRLVGEPLHLLEPAATRQHPALRKTASKAGEARSAWDVVSAQWRPARDLSAGERAERVREALVEVGLAPDDAEKYPHEFSGGQRQRLAIARALITRPALIVLDEPVSALDVSIKAQILDLLAHLQDEWGMAYLLISHDLAVVRAITDRVLIMRDGKIIEEGPTDRVLDHPQHAYTRELVAATPRLEHHRVKGTSPGEQE